MDRNNFKKIATIYTAIFFVVIFLVGMVFFRKDDNNVEENNLKLDNQQLIEGTEDEKITEEERLKTFAENFATIYYSYTWGNFSNIESQYYYMTDEMKKEEESRVGKMKEEIEDRPQRYFTARAKLIDSEFISYEEAKANLKINLNVDNYAGAIVQRDTMIWVDENGGYYGGDSNDLITNTIDKNIEINLVKIDAEWKVDEINEI